MTSFRATLRMLSQTLLCLSIMLGFSQRSFSVPQQVSPSRAEVAGIVRTVISYWQDSSGIKVTPDARGMIVGGFISKEAFLRNAFEKQELNRDQRDSLTISFVEYYLFDLRDAKTERMGGSQPVYEKPSPQSNDPSRVAAPFPRSPRTRRISVINAEDVQKFPVSNFFSVLGPLFMKPMGRLEVTSNPDEATIIIDGQKQGSTCKKFVASTGEHEIQVVSRPDHIDCKGRVNIKADDVERFCCPPGSKCPGFLDGRRCTAP